MLDILQSKPEVFSDDIMQLNQWNACACEESVGYTLVRRFRSSVINRFFAPVNETLKRHKLSSSHLLKSIEPAIWAIIEQQPQEWLRQEYSNYTEFYIDAYEDTKTRLFTQYAPQNDASASNIDWRPLAWGNVNKLSVKHPFASSLGPFSELLNMPTVKGFGDSYMPAVQGRTFGASQRLIVRPGNEEDAVLTIPGGQSGHFLSKYYQKGFMQYAQHQTPRCCPVLPFIQWSLLVNNSELRV